MEAKQYNGHKPDLESFGAACFVEETQPIKKTTLFTYPTDVAVAIAQYNDTT